MAVGRIVIRQIMFQVLDRSAAMRITRLGHFILVGVVVALSAGVSVGAVGDLEYVRALPPGISPGSGGIVMGMRKPSDAAALGLTHAGAMVVADGALVKVAFDADDAKADTLNVARIDVTGKGDFKNAETVKLVQAGPAQSSYYRATFAPRLVEVTKDGKKMPALVSGFYYKRGSRESGSAQIQVLAEGQCRFGDTIRKVLVMDGNRNMKLGDVITRKVGTREYKSADSCRIADDKGQYSTASRASLVTIGQPCQVAGKWYMLTSGGMKIQAKPLGGKLGKLAIDAPRWECMLMGDGYSLNVTGGAEPASIPAGEYSLRMFRLYSQADATKPCPNIYGSQTKPIMIAAGETTSLSLGSDITLSLRATVSSGKVRFSVTQSDAAGSRISVIYGKDGKRPAAPQIDVIDQAGKIVYTAKLAYG